jgi:hypothetical protein
LRSFCAVRWSLVTPSSRYLIAPILLKLDVQNSNFERIASFGALDANGVSHDMRASALPMTCEHFRIFVENFEA